MSAKNSDKSKLTADNIADKCRTRAEIAQFYGISVQTLRRKINKNFVLHDTIPAGLLTPSAIKLIVTCLGIPKPK